MAGWYIMQIDRPEQRRRRSRKTIDDQFRNSSAPTKTGTEQAFNASFATMWGNVSLLMSTIGMAVVFAILLVAANAMMMSARERTRELAVLKTIGFSDRRLFGLVMLEAGLITAHRRGRSGWARPSCSTRPPTSTPPDSCPGFDVTDRRRCCSAPAIALVLMLASGIVPAVRAARLPVVQALRRVE